MFNIKKSIRLFCILGFCLLILYGVINICIIVYTCRNTAEKNKLLEKQIVTYTTNLNEDDMPAQSERKVDFNTLRNVNSDIVGWISVNGTNINYPLLKGQNNAFYLNHSYDKENNRLGSIFMDANNNINFNDFNTVIYGHNIKNGQMFHELQNYLSKDFLEKNNIITIYTQDSAFTYKVLSCFLISVDVPSNVYLNIPTSSPEFNLYLQTVNETYSPYGESFTRDDHILTLSTCTNKRKDERYIVLAKLIQQSNP